MSRGKVRSGRGRAWQAAAGLALLVSTSVPAAAQGVRILETRPTAEAMAADFVLARPAGAVMTAVGGLFYVITLPLTAVTGQKEDAAERFVYEPARFTFKRPLGQF